MTRPTLFNGAGAARSPAGAKASAADFRWTSATLCFSVRDKDRAGGRIGGDREMVFGDVRIRVDPSFALAMHIDTDEGNAANLRTGATGHLEVG